MKILCEDCQTEHEEAVPCPICEPLARARLELNRRQLREFLARTCPEFGVLENYQAEP